MNNTDRLKRRLRLLDQLDASESLDISAFCLRLGVLREIAHTLLDEVEALENVRSVDIKHGIDLRDEVRRFEVDLIVRTLERTGGNQTRAAHLLGLNLTTLHSKLKRHNISPQLIVDAMVVRYRADGTPPQKPEPPSANGEEKSCHGEPEEVLAAAGGS